MRGKKKNCLEHGTLDLDEMSQLKPSTEDPRPWDLGPKTSRSVACEFGPWTWNLRLETLTDLRPET